MNYNNSWHEYLSNLHQYIMHQDNRIKELEQRVVQLEYNLTNQKQHPTIEKLEYHFDQLKIERLDGTLHIGLTPEDMSNVEELAINQVAQANQKNSTNAYPNSHVQPTQNYQPPLKQQLVGQLDSYLLTDGPILIQQFAAEYGYPVDEAYQKMILDDVRKQLPERVAFYEDDARTNEKVSNHYERSKYIYEKVQHEINHSLRKFFQKDQSKGDI